MSERHEEIRAHLLNAWGDAAKNLIDYCDEFDLNFNGLTMDEFLEHCTACGGNWGGMLLTGIKDLDHVVYDLIPERLGIDGMDAFQNICLLLEYVGVETN